MVADLGLEHLQQVLEQLAQTYYRLRVTRHRVQVAEVLTVKRSEYEITFILLVTDVGEGREVGSESETGEDATGRVGADDAVGAGDTDDWRVGLGLEVVEDLTVAEEGRQTRVHHVLEDEVLVVVAELQNVCFQQIVQRQFPLGTTLYQLIVVVDVLLVDISVEYLSIDLVPECGRHSSLSVLHQERLVVFGEESLPHRDSFLDETLLLIHADLPKSHS